MTDFRWVFRVKYSPDQPRVPAGSEQGGQWTSGSGNSSNAFSAQDLNVSGLGRPEIQEGEYTSKYVYQRQESDGFISKITAFHPNGSDRWEVTTTAWGNIFVKEQPVYLAGTGKQKIGEPPPTIEAKSPADAIQKGLEWEEKNRGKLQKRFDYRMQIYENSYNPADKAASAYKYRGSTGLRDLIQEVENNRLAWELSRGRVSRLPFGEDRTITLYRGGSKTGLSWSTKKSEAERFARYGSEWGNVAAPTSGLVGIQAIMRGDVPETVSVHTRKFRANDLLWAYLDGEGEVIVRPGIVKEKSF